MQKVFCFFENNTCVGVVEQFVTRRPKHIRGGGMCVFNIWCLAVCLLLLSMPTQAQNGALPWGTGTPPAWATTKEGIMNKMSNPDTTSFWTVKAAAEAYLAAHPEEVGDDEESGEFTKKYARWEQFWHRRVGSDGNIPAIKKMMKDFALNYDQICDDNGPWQQLGPIISTHQASGFISAIYAPKDQSPVNIIYAGSHDGGLWKTVDGGTNWVNKTDGLRLPGLGINCIVPSPTSPNTMYIATGNSMEGFHNFGMGILKSDNNGDTWTTTTDLDLSTPPPPNPNNYPFYGQSLALKLVFSLSDPTTLYALCNDRLFKTNDDGVSWIWLDQLTPSGIESFFDIRTVPGMPNALVVASKGTNAKVHLSLDNGDTWTDVTPPHAYGALDSHSDKMCIATSNSKVHVIYPYVASGNNTIRPYKIYDLTAATPQWQLVNANVPGLDLDNNDSVFDINLTNENIIYAGKVHLKRSINGGLSFQEIYPIEQHDDVRALQIYTSTTSEANDVLLIGNDGGVSKSTSGGNVWETLNGNLVATEFFDIAVSPARPGVVAGGAQDNSYYKLENGVWMNLVDESPNALPCSIHNDGGHTLIDWSNPNVVYSRFNQYLKKSIDGGNCFNGPNVSNTDGLGGQFDGLKDFLLAQDLQNPNWLYLAKINNFRKIDASTNTDLSTYNFNTGGYSFMEGGGSHAVQSVSIASIAIAPSNPDIIYLAGRVGYETNKGRGVVFKSIDRGVNWTLVNTTSHNINTIAIDPRNAEHIWVGYGDMDNMEWSDLSSGENRIGVSTNGGTTIDDAISHDNGLTPTAVNTLIYDRSASILYAGTDAGVFWYDAPNNHWACFNAGLPVCVVSDLEIDYCKRLIYAGTFGRGIWVAPLPTLPATAEEVITTNTTLPAGSVTNWGTNIRVTPGNTLTVKGLLNMSEDKRIIVQRGAKLIVDGGTITNTCGNRWGGIEVWGNTDVASRHQVYFNAVYTNDNLPPITDYETAPIPLTGPGVVVLKNNALLEYGPLGTIVTQRTDGYYPNHYGGIVVAQDATFLNCKKGVGFMKYRYENYSYFSRCHFISNNNNLPNAKFEGITAWACNGIVVDDCTFDYQTTANTTNDRFGITTTDNLNLIVRNKCKFSLLNQAISLGAGNYLNGTATITDNLFEYNQIGINNLATSSMLATGNQFIGNSPAHQGISIGGTCGYTITNNTFTNLQAGVAAWFTSHDTPGNNLIDCNTYTNCKFGNYLNDNNIGLQLTDNAFDTQTADNKLDNGVNNGAIAFSQGNLDAPHFNLFSTNPATQHFKAPAGQADLFVYYYHTDNDNYTPEVNARLVPKCDAASACTPLNNFLNVYTNLATGTEYTGCLDLNGDGIAGMAAPNPDDCQTKECYYAAKAYLNNLKNEIDGGDKADLLNSLYNSPEALATYQKYMAASPYLSDEVLITAAQTDLMSPNHRANILLSNAPLSNEAMYQIQDLVAPNVYQLLYTIKYYTKFSARDNLNLSISRESAKKEELLHNLLQKFADEKDYAQLDEVLTAENTTYAVRALLSSKAEREHYTDAQAMLSYLPATNPDEQDYKTIQQINLQSLSATAEGFELTDEQYQQLRTIALAYGTQAPYAQTLLGLLRGEHFDWQIPEDDTESGKTNTHPRYKDVALLGKEVLNRLTVTPNPANSSINVALPTYLSEQPAVLNIYNLSGKLLKTLSIDKEQSTANIATTDLPNGIYLVSYIADGITLSSAKVVVQH